MSLELNTIVYGDDVTLADIIELTIANRLNIGFLQEHTNYTPPPDDVDVANAISVRLESNETIAGYDIEVHLDDVGDVGSFTSMQLKANFPVGVDFIGFEAGDMLDEFSVFAQTLDGHSKEGLVGAFTSSLHANSDSGLLGTLKFVGPSAAEAWTTVTRFKLQTGTTVLPITSNSDVVPEG